MTDLWQPSGNKEIDAIEVQIETLFFNLQRAEKNLDYYQTHYTETNLNCRRLYGQMMRLKEDGVVVSMQEYSLMLHDYKKLMQTHNLYQQKLKTVKAEVADLDAKIADLNKKKAKLEPKVLEFKKRETTTQG